MTSDLRPGDALAPALLGDADASERLSFLLEASRRLVSPLDLPATVACLSQLVVPYLADCCLIHLLDDAGSLVPADGIPPPTLPPPVARAMWFTVPPGHPHPLRQAVDSGKAFVATPVLADAWQAMLSDRVDTPAMTEAPYEAMAFVPLRARDRVIGTMMVGYARLADRPQSPDLAQLESLAERAALAIENARLFEGQRQAAAAAVQANKRLEFLATAGSLLAQSLDVDATFARITELAVPSLADVCIVTLNKEDGSLHSPCFRHRDEAGHQALTDLLARAEAVPWDDDGTDPVRVVMASGQSMVVSEVLPDLLQTIAPDTEALHHLQALAVASFMIVPLAAHGRMLGTLAFAMTAASARFGPQDVALAEDLAQRAGLAIENARLYEQMQAVLQRERQARVAAEAAREQQAFLARASDRLGQGLGPGQMAQCLVELVVPRVADWCVVLRLDSDGTLRPLAARHLDADRSAILQALPVVPPETDHPWRAALRMAGPTVISADALADGGHGLPILLPGSGEHLYAPLTVGDRQIGLLILGLDGRDRHFASLEHALAVDLAERAADAVERACLYGDLQQALAREQVARIEAEQAWQHSALLAEAGRTLNESLDLALTAASVADLIVPRLADACGVFRFDAAGFPIPFVLRHRTPAGQALIDVMPPPRPGPLDPFTMLHASGRAILLPTLTDEILDAVSQDEAHRSALLSLAQGAFLLLPMRVQGRLIGAMILAKCPQGETFSPAEQALLGELADRTALSLQNAFLFQEVQQANQRKAEFLAVLGHELRNPLGAVSNGMHLLDRIGGQEPSIRAHRQVMHRQVRQLSRLVSDLLDLSRVDSGKIVLEPERLVLGDLLAQAIEAVQVLHAEREPLIHCSQPQDVVWIDADRVRLTQVLVNLIDNAIKYSPPGREIRVSLETTGPHAVIRVRDQGQGMTPELIDRVFEPFVQGRAGGAGGGLGLGLTLVRTLVELHGGTVQATSDGPGRGSTMTLTLPVGEAPQRPGALPPVQPPVPEAVSRPAVLVVEDHPDAGRSMLELLKVMDFRASLAVDGPDGVAKALELRPRVALVDIGLPGFDGYEVARRLRAELGPAIRLVALTGYGLPEDRAKAYAAGFDTHLTKPVDVEALLALLATTAD